MKRLENFTTFQAVVDNFICPLSGLYVVSMQTPRSTNDRGYSQLYTGSIGKLLLDMKLHLERRKVEFISFIQRLVLLMVERWKKMQEHKIQLIFETHRWQSLLENMRNHHIHRLKVYHCSTRLPMLKYKHIINVLNSKNRNKSQYIWYINISASPFAEDVKWMECPPIKQAQEVITLEIIWWTKATTIHL